MFNDNAPPFFLFDKYTAVYTEQTITDQFLSKTCYNGIAWVKCIYSYVTLQEDTILVLLPLDDMYSIGNQKPNCSTLWYIKVG